MSHVNIQGWGGMHSPKVSKVYLTEHMIPWILGEAQHLVVVYQLVFA